MTVRGGIVELPSFADAEGASVEVQIRGHLEHLLTSPDFDGSARSRQFLKYVVDEVLAGRGDRLHQSSIAVVAIVQRSGEYRISAIPRQDGCWRCCVV